MRNLESLRAGGGSERCQLFLKRLDKLADLEGLYSSLGMQWLEQKAQEPHRDRRHQILPAYTQDGVVLSRVFQGSTDGAVFEDFIEELLHHCGRWPEPKSVLICVNGI